MAQMLNASRTQMRRSMSPGIACKLPGRLKDLELSPVTQPWKSQDDKLLGRVCVCVCVAWHVS